MSNGNNFRAAGKTPQVNVKLVQERDAQVERGLHGAFRAAVNVSDRPATIAAMVSRSLGAGAMVTPEAERGDWSRYRVAMRVQGLPVTIATVEVTLPG